jgi:hypothetical protein
MFKNKTNFVGGGTVNLYFYQAFLDIWNGGMRDDFLTLKNANPGFELWVRLTQFQLNNQIKIWLLRSPDTLSVLLWPVYVPGI